MSDTWDPTPPVGYLVSCEAGPDGRSPAPHLRGLAGDLATSLGGVRLALGSRACVPDGDILWWREVAREAHHVVECFGLCVHLALCGAADGGEPQLEALYGARGSRERRLAAWLVSGLQGCGLRAAASRTDGPSSVPWLRDHLPAERYVGIELHLPEPPVAAPLQRGMPFDALLATWTLAVTAGWAVAPPSVSSAALLDERPSRVIRP